MNKSKAQNAGVKNKTVIKVVLKTAKKRPALIFAVVVLLLLDVAVQLVPPQILRLIIDDYIQTGTVGGILPFAVLYAGAMVCSCVVGVLFLNKICIVFGAKIITAIRAEMMEKLEKIPPLYFSLNPSGEVVSRIVNDADDMAGLFSSDIIFNLVDLFKVVGIVVSIFIFSPWLGLFALILLPLIYFSSIGFRKATLAAQVKSRVIIGKVNNHISESLKNSMMIKAYGKEAYFEEGYDQRLKQRFAAAERVNIFDSVFSPFIQLLRAAVIGIIVVLVAASGVLDISALGISAGALAASIALISNLFDPVENIAISLLDMQRAFAGIKRIDEFLASQEDDPKPDITAEQIIPSRANISIRFENVSFAYQEGSEVLKDINLEFNSPIAVTFAGRTGAGKSTLIKLIAGLLKPQNGRIMINGVNVCDIPSIEKRSIFGYCNQDIRILNGTVAQQVSLNDQGITPVQIDTALKFAGLFEYVQSLKDGADTLMTDAGFSQGQKQLLAIARAIAADPPILLLDEVTANIDSVTEERITEVLRRAGKDRAVFSVSHRLRAMLFSDAVAVLENGRVKSVGAPRELLQSDEWFKARYALEEWKN